MATPTAIAAFGVAAGFFQDSLGNKLSNGRLTFDLSQPAAASGGGEVVPRRVAITLDTNGVPSSGQVIWRNTDLSPSGTTYGMKAFDSNGNFVGDFGIVIISGASPIDLTIIVPSLVNTSTVGLSGVVLTNPTVTQSIVGFPSIDFQLGGFGVAMVRLADTTLGAPAATIAFSSISQAFKHLRIHLQARTTGAVTVDSVTVQFNGDTGANYDQNQLQASNAVASAGPPSNASTSIAIGAASGANTTRANIAGITTIDILNYANTAFEKQAIGICGSIDSTAANCFVLFRVGSWRNTAPISSIVIGSTNSGNFVAGTRATLYGLN